MKALRCGTPLFTWAIVLLWPFPAAAEGSPRDLRYDTAIDVAVTGTGGALWVASELLKGDLAPASCRWCDRHADGTDGLNGVDEGVRRGLRWSSTGAADTLSNVTGFALAPISALGLTALAAAHDDAISRFPVDALIVGEATVLAADLSQLAKFTFGRERPFVHVLPNDEKPVTSHPFDNNLSFFSGHTTLAFALATSSGTVASMRGYRLAPVVWATGMAFAATVGYLRIAADRHYFTDILAGAAVGACAGFAIPLLLHGPDRPASDNGRFRPTFGTTPLRGGHIVTLSWVW